MFSLARSKISEFNGVAFDKDVLRFYITMEYSLSMHELNGFDHLKHVILYFLVSQRIFLAFEALVKVHVHEFENESQFALIRESVPLG